MAKLPIKEQKDRLSKINALLEKLDERLVQGEITEARYKELSDQYKAEAEKLKNQVTEQELMQEVGLKAEEKEEVEYKEKVKYIEKARYREEEPEKEDEPENPVFEEHGTKYCSSCGTLIDENSEFCNKCGEKVSTPQAYREKKIRTNNINTNVGVSTSQVYQEKKSAALAAVSNLIIPGVGQMYCGKWMRGIGILIVTIILYAVYEASVESAGMYSDEPIVPLIIFIIYRIWSIYDAYALAGKINRGEAY
ncbi:MAG: zinc-ribbon domain-containing protein [Candidatus Methanoperedens sp.]|nr:zinc-ribbon domain-containing protein [Candidatus Methanoperedens sp.]